MAELQPRPRPDLIAGEKAMLFGVPVDHTGHETVRYFVEEAEGPMGIDDEGVRQALSVIGAWRDLDWEHALDELDRIRHESHPTPPIDRI